MAACWEICASGEGCALGLGAEDDVERLGRKAGDVGGGGEGDQTHQQCRRRGRGMTREDRDQDNKYGFWDIFFRLHPGLGKNCDCD